MGLFSGIGRMLGIGTPKGIKNPAESAMPYLNQIPGIGRQYHEPFIKAGQEAQGVTQPIYQRQAQDPAAFLDSIIRGYNPSEGYKFKENVLGRAMQNTAAQGGYAGTPYSQLQQGDLIRGLLVEDQQEYLNNVMNVQDRGLQGLGDIQQRGFQSSGALADYIGNAFGQQGGLAYQGQAQQNQLKYDQMANRARFFGDIARAFGMGMGGGGSDSGAGLRQGLGLQPGGVIGGGAFQFNGMPRNWVNPNRYGGY